MIRQAYAFFLLTAIALALLPTLSMFHAEVLTEYKLVRTPEDVYSGQPVLIFAYVPSGGDVELEVSISLEAKVGAREYTPSPVVHRVPMIPIPWASGWYVVQIPGLPAKSWSFQQLGITIGITVASKVTYKLVVDGAVVAFDSYVVKEGEISKYMPPFTYAFIYDVLKDPSIVSETLGLGPHGWVVGGGENVKIMVLAFDEKSQPTLRFEYRVGGASWAEVSVGDSPFMEKLNSLVSYVNTALKSVENWVKQFYKDITIPEPKLTIKIAEAVIPPQNFGTYVMFKATAKDVDGNTMTSPTGFYYVVNKVSTTKVLIVDPHVWLWLLKENVNQVFNTSKHIVSYEIPEDVIAPLRYVWNVSKTIVNYGLVLFHHWEYLGKYYNIYISWPNRDVATILNTFKPNVIILSSLGLGLKDGGLWNWDLRDVKVDGGSLLDRLTSYVKENHAGLIATHATLSDEILWTSCEDRVKVGTRGHVGYDLTDVNILSESTVAALLGMPELALWEYVRDAVAKALCSYPQTQPIGMLVGSTPLQIPHVPWDGVLKLTLEAGGLGWDLPQEFTVEMPTLAREYGFKAYTEVGWQLALPRALAYVAWDSASKAGAEFTIVKDRVASLYNNITKGVVKTPELSMYLDKALDHVIGDFYKALNSARIRGTALNMSIAIAEVGKPLNISVDVGKEALINLMQKMPVKIVALSPKGLAGVITYDKFWDSNGYRAVYFSFEVEAAEGEVVEKLLINSVEWVRKWRYLDITELLGGLVRIPKDTASRFKEVVANAPGKELLSNGLMLNEEGGAEVKLDLTPGRLYLVIAHPTSDVSVGVAEGPAKIVNITKTDNHITQVAIEVEGYGSVVISLKAGSEASLNPAYLTAKFESYPTLTETTTATTVTTTVTVTKTTTVTITEVKTTAAPATTVTETKTTTVPTTITTVRPTTVVTTEVKTLTTTTAIPITIVQTQTLTQTTTTQTTITITTPKTETTTATQTITDWTTTGIVAVVLLVIGIALGYFIKRK
ncbi:MAG: hypothetical protein B7O98_01855 [Zestosphaera tikiterensis]|uniref:Uncharacterized protein n=1 Tax=Zestosphaera tikiterensis TaxID=1973259 RepID=A0A2R7Y6N2_9CREN|nr:MAG: hypothetical protein B7O98_01855 [Zestosphaera tikiterensis]